MAILSFSLSPEATGLVYELLVCLAKFGEQVSIEARSDKLTITAVNLSRTAYSSFALDASTFFISYDFRGNSAATGGDRFTCQLLNKAGLLIVKVDTEADDSSKALQSVFKGRTNDFRRREGIVERCEVTVQDQPDKTECRFIVKMLCKYGMTKTYRLTYESVEVMHALFDRTAASQGWKISARVLREYIEYFGPKTEQLDLLAQEGKAIFTSFTEKISDGREVLKQPLETAISIHTEDFDDFHMQENMHIVISVRDFKAIVNHAETLRGSISASFSFPTRPLQFHYQHSSMHCEFTLMTTGDYRGASSMPNPNFISTRGGSRQPSIVPVQVPSRKPSDMPPPPARPIVNKPLSSQSQRTSLKAQVQPPAAVESDPDPESLFMPRGDDEDTWDPPNYENEEEEEMLGWDASNENPGASFHSTFRDSGTVPRQQAQQKRAPHTVESQDGLEPTQRLSQLHGMFD